MLSWTLIAIAIVAIAWFWDKRLKTFGLKKPRADGWRGRSVISPPAIPTLKPKPLSKAELQAKKLLDRALDGKNLPEEND